MTCLCGEGDILNCRGLRANWAGYTKSTTLQVWLIPRRVIYQPWNLENTHSILLSRYYE